jgi:hypothetical protein
MELTERITSRVSQLTGEIEVLRKQLSDAEHELDRLIIAGQVITQLTADEQAAVAGGPAQRGFGLLVLPRSQASAQSFSGCPTGRPGPGRSQGLPGSTPRGPGRLSATCPRSH